MGDDSYFSDGIQCEDFRHLEIDHFVGRQSQTSGAAISLARGESISISNSTADRGTDVFVRHSNVTGKRLLLDDNLGAAKKAVEPLTTGVRMSGVVLPARPSNATPPASKR